MTIPADQLQTQHVDLRRPASGSVETTDLWALWEAAHRLLPANVTPHRFHGLTGGALRRYDDTLVYNDLEAWIVPGLAALDIRVSPTLLPEDHAACADLLRACLRGGRTAPLLIYGETEKEKEETEQTEKEKEAASVEATGDAERKEQEEALTEAEGIESGAPLVRQRLIVGVSQGLDEIFVQDEAGRQLMVGISWLRTGRAVVLQIGRQAHRGTRRGGLREALRRWAVFAAAQPERILSPYEEDRSLRALAAGFLGDLVGTRQDRLSGMLRRAAEGFVGGVFAEDIQDALDYLRAVVAEEFQLSPRELDALLSPPAYALSDIERRELIYLARAGMRDLRVLAARRLASEQSHDDARRTLDQLRYDEDAWVRAASAAL